MDEPSGQMEFDSFVVVSLMGVSWAKGHSCEPVIVGALVRRPSMASKAAVAELVLLMDAARQN